EVRLDRPGGAGYYRLNFTLPKVPGWQVPWRVSLHLKGEALVYLNGTLIGRAAGSGEQEAFTELYLPDELLKPAGTENLLALSLAGEGAALMKVGITPWMEHAVCRHEVIFFK
ncbi:MAG: hypothetical protein QHJ73_19395, partial [Armatimonadota bacterium]|nr:hypothetical protein [Armatimonadota bacterium]